MQLYSAYTNKETENDFPCLGRCPCYRLHFFVQTRDEDLTPNKERSLSCRVNNRFNFVHSLFSHDNQDYFGEKIDL